jgi:methionine-rich copper-binding protein CopC
LADAGDERRCPGDKVGFKMSGIRSVQEVRMMIIGRSIFGCAAGAAMILSAATTAFAHAHLVRATPAVGTTIHEAPAEVLLRFNEKIETAFSTVVVRDSAGKQVDKADAQVDKTDRLQMRVSVPALTPGTYKVEWRVMSADTHKVNGNFTFVVGE